MDVRPSSAAAAFDWTIAEVERGFDRKPAPGTPEADRFDVLSALIEAYEGEESGGWGYRCRTGLHGTGWPPQTDLAAMLGSRSRDRSST